MKLKSMLTAILLAALAIQALGQKSHESNADKTTKAVIERRSLQEIVTEE